MDDQAEAFDDFVRRSAARLARLGFALSGDRGIGEDLAQECLRKLWRRWDHLAARGDVWPYATQVLVMQWRSWRRIRWRSELVGLALHDALPANEEPQIGAAEALVVQDWLRQLPRGQRAVVVLRYLEDLTLEQTADILHCRIGSVKSQASKALTKLRNLQAASNEPRSGDDAVLRRSRNPGS